MQVTDNPTKRISHIGPSRLDTKTPSASTSESTPNPRLLISGQLLGLILLVVGNAIWLGVYRAHLVLNIDEAGYMQRSLQFGQAIRSGSLLSVINVWKSPSIIAPILPLFSGIIESITHLDIWGLLGAEQFFYALAIVASYFLARRLSGRIWSSIIAVVVASLPGMIDASRTYYLAEPCVALFTLALVIQLRANDFSRLRSAVIWGVVLGITALTRSMVLALLPALIVPALVRAVMNSKSRSQSVRNIAIGLAVCFVVAGSWYLTSWNTVYHYLTQYGYGKSVNQYNVGPSANRWTIRFENIANQDIYFPIICGIFIAVVIAAISRVVHRQGSFRLISRIPTALRERFVRHDNDRHQSHLREQTTEYWPVLQRLINRDEFSIVAVLLLSLAALLSTTNSGSYFELPILPALVVLLLGTLGRLGKIQASLIVASLALACGLTLADQFGMATQLDLSSVSFAGLSFASFAYAQSSFVGSKLRNADLGGLWWSNCGGATVSCFYGPDKSVNLPYVTAWPRVNTEVVSFLYQFAPQHGYQPVVFFAYQGPMFNTNTVGLVAQQLGKQLPIGALVPPSVDGGVGWIRQLEDPSRGQPNFVIAGDPAGKAISNRESNSVDRALVAQTLRADGFRVVKTIDIPDATAIEIWWKNR